MSPLYNNLQTPCFIFNRDLLLKELDLLKEARKSFWENTIISYSVKTNSLPYLASVLNKEGVYAEVVSSDEYDMVIHQGYESDKIVCNGPIKKESFLKNILSSGVKVNIDSHEEIINIKQIALHHPDREINVGIRVNIDIERYFPGESNAGDIGSRFGFSEETGDLGNIIEELKTIQNVKIRGLHLHVSTKTRRVEIYKFLVRQFDKLQKRYRLNDIDYLDIGGGFFGGIAGKPQWRDYFKGISEELISLGYSKEKLTLIIEPGVSLLASSLSYITKIVDVKKTVRSNFAVCDGSRIHIDPFFHKTDYFYERINIDTLDTNKIDSQILAGFTCLENDRILTIREDIPFKIGDFIKFNKLGAYTVSLSPLFISYFPPVYEIQEDGIKCVRDKWTANEFLQLSQK